MQIAGSTGVAPGVHCFRREAAPGRACIWLCCEKSAADARLPDMKNEDLA